MAKQLKNKIVVTLLTGVFLGVFGSYAFVGAEGISQPLLEQSKVDGLGEANKGFITKAKQVKSETDVLGSKNIADNYENLLEKEVGYLVKTNPDTPFKAVANPVYDETKYVELPYTIVDDNSRQLIYSDSPEYVTKDGVIAGGTIGRTASLQHIVAENTNVLTDINKKALRGATVNTAINKLVKKEVQKVDKKEKDNTSKDISFQQTVDRNSLDIKNKKQQNDLPVTESKGLVNVYYYHVNSMNRLKKIVIFGENTTNTVKTGLLEKVVTVPATPAYFTLGRGLAVKLLEPNTPINQSFSIAPYNKQVIYESQEAIAPEALTSGIAYIKTEIPLAIRVAMIDADAKADEVIQDLPVIPEDEHALRGLFPAALRQINVKTVYNSDIGSAYVALANNTSDPFEMGIDELEQNKKTVDFGNYGVMYQTHIHTQGQEPFNLYVNPRGGAYAGGFKVKAVRTNQEGQKIVTSEKIYEVPTGDLPYIGNGTSKEAWFLGTYAGGSDITITWMPAGASNLPIRFVLVPKGMNK